MSQNRFTETKRLLIHLKLVWQLQVLAWSRVADQKVRRECYLHGYVSSGIMKQVRDNPEHGLAITIAATKVDGIVLSLTPNSHSYNYRSAVLFGYGSLVEACTLSKTASALDDFLCCKTSRGSLCVVEFLSVLPWGSSTDFDFLLGCGRKDMGYAVSHQFGSAWSLVSVDISIAHPVQENRCSKSYKSCYFQHV